MAGRRETVMPELGFRGWTGVSHQKLGKGSHFREEKIWKTLVDQEPQTPHVWNWTCGLCTEPDPFSVLPISPSIQPNHPANPQLPFPHGTSPRWILPLGPIWFYPSAPMPPATRACHLSPALPQLPLSWSYCNVLLLSSKPVLTVWPEMVLKLKADLNSHYL